VPSAASVQKDKVMVQAMWNLAARKRWAADFPELPRIKVPKRLPTGRAYTFEDVAKLVLRAKRRQGHTGGKPSAWWWSTLIYAAYCTGERYSALTSLRWGQVDLDRRRVIFLGETRKGRTRDIERDIAPELAAMLAAQQGPPEALVWPWDRKSRAQWNSLKLLCRLAGVKYRGFHGFRRTAASYAALAGGTAAATQLLDHADPNMQQVYVDPTICPQARATLPPGPNAVCWRHRLSSRPMRDPMSSPPPILKPTMNRASPPPRPAPIRLQGGWTGPGGLSMRPGESSMIWC
jgi:integrase